MNNKRKGRRNTYEKDVRWNPWGCRERERGTLVNKVFLGVLLKYKINIDRNAIFVSKIDTG